MKNKHPLPYLNNGKLIILTIGINVVCALAFWHRDFGLKDLLADTVCCATITAFFDVFVVSYIVRKKRTDGTLPHEVPQSRWIRLLPRNCFGLSAVMALFFALLMLGINGGLFRFYAMHSLSLPQFLLWKAVYSLVLSAWIIEFAIFRLVQPDCGPTIKTDTANAEMVKNPMPHIAWITAFLRGMIFDFGFNVAFGLLLGGTVLRGMEVIILPTPCKGTGMLITTAFTGIIVAFFVIPAVAASVMATISGGNVPPIDKAERFFSIVPRNRWLLTLFLSPFFALLTVLVCGGIFMLFDFSTLNFFQFYLIRAIYISLLCKAVLPFIIRRYRQPDVIATMCLKQS